MINKDTIIVTDSSCDLSDETLEKLNIKMIPLRIITKTQEYRDRFELSPEELYDIMENELPTSSLPLPEDVENMYNKLYQEGYKNIIHLTISSGLSGTYNMIKLVAEDFKDKLNIYVVDTKTLSGGLGTLVLRAVEELKIGTPIENIIEKIHALRQKQLGMFIVRTLEYLRKGGRISLVEGVVGSLLQIKPVIFVNDDGIYQTISKARGFIKAKSTMMQQAIERYKNELVDIYIVHGLALEEAKEIAEKLKSTLNIKNLTIAPVSPVLAIHTGKGLIGMIITPVKA